ncbi:P1 family peptidase [Chloroflexota bacterium]
MNMSLTDIPGIKVGHYTDRQAVTGCTVVVCEKGAVAGVDIRGSAPGTRDTDALMPVNLIDRINAIVISGGSAFGLDTAGGVMRYLEERGFGFQVAGVKVPIVPTAILFDLDIGNSDIRPGIEEGYKACLAANDGEIAEGCVGAGTGATVGKILGIGRAIKSGLGMAGREFGDGVIVAALVAVNAVGDVIDYKSGKLLAGPRSEKGNALLSTIELVQQGFDESALVGSNTTLGIVATNANLNKAQVNKVAQMTHDGLARTINPCHTMYDGDTIFALSSGDKKSDANIIGAIAAEVMADAVVRAVTQAETIAGIPSIKDIG